jgi:hypothetical protein
LFWVPSKFGTELKNDPQTLLLQEHDKAPESEDRATKEDGAAKQPEDQPPGKVPDFIPLPLPKAIIEVLKTQVFGFDTFFVTGQEAFPEVRSPLLSKPLLGEVSPIYSVSGW